MSLSLSLSLWVSESLNLWGKSRLCDVWWSVWCDHLCVFFLWKKMVGQFQPQAKLEVKDLETWNIETNRTEVWAPIWELCICDSSLIKWATNRTNLTFAFGVWWYLGGPSPKSPSPMPFLWDLGQWLDELRRNAYKKKSWEIKWDLQLRTSVCLKNAARNTGWLNARQFLANGFLQQNW